ncbi:MAG: acyltransferase family protein [Pararhodobacter sp.]
MSPSYRPEIDGLRAVAVLPVIFFHAGFTGFSGGFVGVDVFFVISGYLITGILVSDLRNGRFSIARFYERRARRILPALFVLLAASALAAHLLLMPPPFMDFSASLFSVVLFLSNMLFISEVDYFAPAAEDTPLLHTWSLAVEEQFYILFPLILWALWRAGRGKGLLAGVALITVASLVFSEWAWRAYPAQSFYFLPSRAWELGAGALCALVPQRAPDRPGALRQALGLAGLTAIAVSVVALDRTYPFPSLWALLPVGGSVAVILWATPGTWAARLLSLRVMVGIGLISYSAYLWHHPVFVFARALLGVEPGAWTMAGLSALSLSLAALSWRWVEQPFRQHDGKRPWLPRRWQVFAASAAGIGLLAGLGLWGYLTEGRAALWLRNASPVQRQTYALLGPAHRIVRNLDDGGCRFNLRRVTPEARARLDSCFARHGPGVAIVGDSHAINLADALIVTESAPFLFGVTQGNCRPDSPRDECGFDGLAELVEENPHLFSRVLFEVSGLHLIVGPGGRRGERLFRMFDPEAPIPAEQIRVDAERIARNAAFAERLSRHVPTVWLTPRIEPHLPDAHVMAHGCDYPFTLRPGQANIFERLARDIADAAAPEVIVIDQTRVLAFEMPGDFITCEALYWSDGNHLSAAGLERFGPRLAAALLP